MRRPRMKHRQEVRQRREPKRPTATPLGSRRLVALGVSPLLYGAAFAPLAEALFDRYCFRNTEQQSMGREMETVTVSPKFQVVIPKGMREALKLTPGQKVQALLYENRIELIPVRPVKRM